MAIMSRAATYMTVAAAIGAISLGIGTVKAWFGGASMMDNYAVTAAFFGGLVVAVVLIYYRDREPPSRRTKVGIIAIEYSFVAITLYFQFTV